MNDCLRRVITRNVYLIICSRYFKSYQTSAACSYIILVAENGVDSVLSVGYDMFISEKRQDQSCKKPRQQTSVSKLLITALRKAAASVSIYSGQVNNSIIRQYFPLQLLMYVFNLLTFQFSRMAYICPQHPSLSVVLFPCNDFGQAVHTYVSITKKCNLVPVKGR